MTTSAAAQALHVTRRRVTYMIAAGVLPAKRDAESGAWIIDAKSVETVKCCRRGRGRPRKIHAFIIEP